ncbi:hypothetical protein [Myxococcus sp. RHSTA-1-4]|uniref:hypothetical protein n=1 Tax=Myxococcus sp. RHSTA-1-4 TaxID=2874601 RepID=UPI001CBDFB49|nr:hypothetical protein [Myxococcus sp. RHSTA-1-4]
MKRYVLGGACAVALGGGAAWAQEDYLPPAEQSADVETVEFDTENRADKGVYALIGGGAEGYTGQLAPAVNPGLSYGATVGLRPWAYFGFELGYTGGVNDVDPGDGGISGGADIVRNGGQAVVVGSFTDTKLQPYALTGVGIDNYNIQNDNLGELLGYDDDTSAFVPAGLGLRYQMGDLITADARVSYNFLLGQDFAPSTLEPGGGDGRYNVLLSLGGTY